MKKWESPVIKVMSVKLSENIASSNGSDGYEVGYVFLTNGVITYGGHNYRYNASGIQDTSVQWYGSGNDKYVDKAYEGSISGCLA